jgi:glycosyltransferase involved in cell wall biosynthesis
MNKHRALFLVCQESQTLFHHRGKHLASHLAKRFGDLDIVSIAKLHDGPGSAPIWEKVFYSLKNLIFDPIKINRFENVAEYAVRFPYRPAIFDYLLRDFWSYINLREMFSKNYDVCILASPRLAFIGLHLKRLGIVNRLIYEDWDYFPAHRPGGFFWRNIMRIRENECVSGADGVASVSHSLLELRSRQGAKRTIFVPNGVDYALFSQAQIRLPHPPTILFMGKLDEAWGADLPIKALPIIKDVIPDIQYILLGAGPDENNLHALVTDLELENHVAFCGWQEYSSLPQYLAQADLGVATYRDYEFVRFSRPLKIIEYMAAGLPVISTRIAGEIRDTLESSRAGEMIDFSPEEFARVALNILSDQQKYQHYSENAVIYASKMDWEWLFDQELTFIEDLASS